MILQKLILGNMGTNCYIFGSDKHIVVIDPGFESKRITEEIKKLGPSVNVAAVLLTHGHFDHCMKAEIICRSFNAPLMYCKNEIGHISIKKDADRWLAEGDTIELDNITLHVLETPGHSPGGISFFTKDVKEINGQKYEGIIFTGDLLFRRSIGRTDFPGGDSQLLFSSIKKKIMYNPDITDYFFILPGHMGNSTVGDERNMNMFKQHFT